MVNSSVKNQSKTPTPTGLTDIAASTQKLETTVIHVGLAELKHLTKNARYMTADQLKRLTENLRRDGELTSYPLVYRPDKKLNPKFFDQSKGELVILSGNHRIEAAKNAGIEKTNAIEIKTRLPDERLLAIQLSHNSINGQDDPSALLGLYESLSLDEKLYSGLTDDDFEVEPIDVAGLAIGSVNYAELNLAFVPQDLKDVNAWLNTLEKQGRKNPTHVGRYDDFDELYNAVIAVKATCKVYNSAAAFAYMAQLAMERLEQIQSEKDG